MARRGGSIGDRLAAAARSIIAEARAALSSRELTDAEAVHALRKAVKRWRALLRLLTQPVGAEAEKMRIEARALMRSLAGARDAQAALDALADLRKSGAPFTAVAVETIRQRLNVIRDGVEAASFTSKARKRISRYLDRAVLLLERWPLQAADVGVVADALTSTYRRARRLLPEDWHAAEPERLHELRRRVVEHRHQMELTEPLWPRVGERWAGDMKRLRQRLGACQDLTILARFTGPHQPLAPWRSRLLPLVEARRAAHVKDAAQIAARLFAERPKAFRKRVAALRQARPDPERPPHVKAAADATPRRLSSFAEGSSTDETGSRRRDRRRNSRPEGRLRKSSS